MNKFEQGHVVEERGLDLHKSAWGKGRGVTKFEQALV